MISTAGSHFPRRNERESAMATEKLTKRFSRRLGESETETQAESMAVKLYKMNLA